MRRVLKDKHMSEGLEEMVNDPGGHMKALLQPSLVRGEVFEARARWDHVHLHLNERSDDGQDPINESFPSDHLQQICLVGAWSWLWVDLLDAMEVKCQWEGVSK